tara:strand:+ start:335 stop:577 length:243 start_codon:yes stop_codon:yes gene_type:complete
MKAEITSRRGTPIIYHGAPYSSDCDIELREIECHMDDCPHKLDSEAKNWIEIPSYCINLGDDQQPFWACLPCSYKGGAVG